MSFIKLPLEVLTADNLTAGEKITYAALVNFTVDESTTYIGCYKLAEFLNTSRSAVIRSLKSLENKKYIKINPRKNRSKSNEILLDPEGGYNFSLVGAKKSSQGTQSDTGETQSDTPYIEKDLNIPDLKKARVNEGTQFDTPNTLEEKKKATADVAAVRSMPNEDSAMNDEAISDQEAKDQALFALIKHKFPDFDLDFQLVRGSKKYYIRKISQFCITNNIFADDIAAYAREQGYQLKSTYAYMPQETIIKGVA